MEQVAVKEILEDMCKFEYEYNCESPESMHKIHRDGDIQIEECRKTLGHNSRLVYLTLPSRKVFMKQPIASPRTFSGTKISGSKTKNPSGKEMMWLTLFGEFFGFVPEVVFYNEKTSRIYMEHFEAGSLDDNIDNIFEQKREVESSAQIKKCSNPIAKMENLNIDILDYTGDMIRRFIDIQLIHDNIARTVLKSKSPLLDFQDYDNNLENVVSTFGKDEIKVRIDEFFTTVVSVCDNKEEYTERITELNTKISGLQKSIDGSGPMGVVFNLGKNVRDLSTQLSERSKELSNLSWVLAHHDDILQIKEDLAKVVDESNSTKVIDYKYKGKDRRFSFAPKYLSYDFHPGNCLMQDSLEFKPTDHELRFMFNPLSTSGTYSPQNMVGIAELLKKFRENKDLKQEERQSYDRLCKQYKGLAATDFHKFGEATMPFSLAVFFSHPSTLEIPYERKLDYVDHTIAQELRISLREDISLDRKEFSAIKTEWVDRFRKASVYMLLKNITYLYNLVKKEKQNDYGENGTLIDEKKFNKDKPKLFRNYVNYLLDITGEDKDNDNLFGRVYRTFKDMSIALPKIDNK